MSNRNIWEASSNGDLDRVKYLIEVERIGVDIQNNNDDVIN